jgi:hypothetical protein
MSSEADADEEEKEEDEEEEEDEEHADDAAGAAVRERAHQVGPVGHPQALQIITLEARRCWRLCALAAHSLTAC